MRSLVVFVFALAFVACAASVPERRPDDACEADCARDNDRCVADSTEMNARTECSHAFAACRRRCE